MADRPYQFVGPLLKAMHSVADDLGTDVMHSGKGPYNVTLELLALLAMTLKIIQDLAPTTVTDAYLQQRLNVAIDTGPGGDRSGWPGWILLQIAPEKLAQLGATETDTVPVLQAKLDAWYAANPGGVL